MHKEHNKRIKHKKADYQLLENFSKQNPYDAKDRHTTQATAVIAMTTDEPMIPCLEPALGSELPDDEGDTVDDRGLLGPENA